MLLIHMYVRPQTGGTERGVSVWVEADGAAEAERRAGTALASEGWIAERIESVVETSADDYFRSCPSQQAFQRAQSSGLAWRFDDE